MCLKPKRSLLRVKIWKIRYAIYLNNYLYFIPFSHKKFIRLDFKSMNYFVYTKIDG